MFIQLTRTDMTTGPFEATINMDNVSFFCNIENKLLIHFLNGLLSYDLKDTDIATKAYAALNHVLLTKSFVIDDEFSIHPIDQPDNKQ